MHINDDEIPTAQNKITFQSLINGNEIKSSYGEQIKNFFKIIRFDRVWRNKGSFSKRSLINAVEKKLIGRYNSFFKEAITGRITVKGRTLDNLRTYEMFKNNYKMETI